MTKEQLTIVCPACGAHFKREKAREEKHPLAFCAYCGYELHGSRGIRSHTSLQQFSSISLPSQEAPKESEIQMTIGQYQILKSIGKGGMGEVFLAYDTVSGRRVALKRIRQDLVAHPQLQNRFLREARITSQLIHPTIIPIYSIHQEDQLVYYTMPFVEGNTLRQLLRHAKGVEKKSMSAKDHQTSIPALTRLFLQVCQACAYAHSHGVLHRDLKPENFIIGNYGQVLILDWGLAKMIDSENTEDEDLPEELLKEKHIERITRIGKVVGTIAYMAPERALGEPATIQTDIYSLGVILYQILTLAFPFHRKSLAHFKQTFAKESFVAPELLAPYREVPQILSEVVKKCLAADPKARYQSVDELIESLEGYIEGRSEWFHVSTLDIKKKDDWEFQENILIAEHTAITRATDVSDWVNLMISKDSFPNNTKIEADVRIREHGHGIGFLFSLPEALDRRHLTEGYSLWLASAVTKKTRLLRSSVSVFEMPELVMPYNEWQRVRIEKIDGHIFFYLNDVLQFSYVSHTPVVGTHVGILTKDSDFDLKNFRISIGSQNISVSCLAVPDAFLANKDYKRALSEYRRIGASFPGRTEGREALFRAGITLLEQAKTEEKEMLYDLAHQEFSKLRKTAGAPLEYLGKALIYETLKEHEEEVKCYEIAIRRYKKHPLIAIIEEQIIFRMHESSRQSRRATYEFISLAVRFLSHLASSRPAIRLFKSLENNWEIPPFILTTKEATAELQRQIFCLNLAFWLAKPYLIKETLDELLQQPILPRGIIADALFLLIELGALPIAEQAFQEIAALLSEAEQARLSPFFEPLKVMMRTAKGSLTEGIEWLKKCKTIGPDEERVLFFFMRRAIHERKIQPCRDLLEAIQGLSIAQKERLDAYLIELYLILSDVKVAQAIIESYPEARRSDHSSPLYSSYGLLLAALHGKERAKKHFARLLDTPYPRSWLLSAHYLTGTIHLDPGGWIDRSFLWERRSLYEQLALFYHVVQDEEKSQAFRMLSSKEYVHDE